MKAQSRLWLWLWELFEVWDASSCICNTLVAVCAMKGIPIGPLAQWGKDLTYYLTPFFCLVNWDMYYSGSACRGTDLPSGRYFYIRRRIYIYIIPYRNSTLPPFPFLNFHNYAREKFLKYIFLQLMNLEKFSNWHNASDIWLRSLKFSV